MLSVVVGLVSLCVFDAFDSFPLVSLHTLSCAVLTVWHSIYFSLTAHPYSTGTYPSQTGQNPHNYTQA